MYSYVAKGVIILILVCCTLKSLNIDVNFKKYNNGLFIYWGISKRINFILNYFAGYQ